MYRKWLFIFIIFFDSGVFAMELKLVVTNSFHELLQNFLAEREYDKLIVDDFFLQHSQKRLEQCFHRVKNSLAQAEERDLRSLTERVFSPRNISELELLMFNAEQRGYYGAFLYPLTDGDFCQKNLYGQEKGVLLGGSLAVFCFVNAHKEKSFVQTHRPKNIYDELNGIVGILQRVCAYKKVVAEERLRNNKRVGA